MKYLIVKLINDLSAIMIVACLLAHPFVDRKMQHSLQYATLCFYGALTYTKEL